MYSDYLSINKNFQSSVNLELDLNNDNKIMEYIPTTDICDVLKKYVKTALGIEKNFATTLIGPYGKGKSFLLLVLSYIFNGKTSDKCWLSFLKKVKAVDDELFDLLSMLKKNNLKLLPVIINSNYDNIIQSLQIALNEALHREGLDDIIPRSAFDVCLSLLDKWEEKESVKEEVLNQCEKLHKIDLTKLRKGLKNYSESAYKQFEALYNCVNIGLEFNPLVNNDIVKIYSDISVTLSEKGYNGMFVIFDEFSKFLENHTSHLMHDLKIIQDLAELAARSGKNQVHICCVAHKNIALYDSTKKQKQTLDSLKTVEGRFKEIKFNRSLNENYQIISSAIIKDYNSIQMIEQNIDKQQNFYNMISELSLFDNDINKDVLYKGCYPLNPITTYSLIQISELVAQNERTLFTFLTDTDDNSFNSFIHKSSSGLFNVDKIYDYFNGLFQKEETNYVRNIWYRTESILSKVEDDKSRRIIKSLSVILMINDVDKCPPTEELIALSANIELSSAKKIISQLIDEHYLRRNILNNLLSFALSNTKQIDDNIELFRQTKFNNTDYGILLSTINDKKYFLPRKYNEQNKITRFYNVIFMSEDIFNSVKSFNYYFDENYCDGLIINLLRNELTEAEIVNKINELNDHRIFIRYPKEKISDVFYQSLIRLACLNEIKKQKNIDEIIYNEIDLLTQESEDDIKTLIDNYFNNNSNYYIVEKNTNSSFNQQISQSMEKIYPVKLIFNNELINKKDVSTQYQKAINHVIDWLLDGEKEFLYSETSPEMSVKKSIIDKNSEANSSESADNFRRIIDEIKEKIISSKSEKIDVYSLISEYRKPPYGIRNGILPMILAYAISELSSDNVILYYQLKEIELDSNNLVKALNSDKYSISYSKGSLEQKNYLSKLIKLFEVKTLHNFRKDTANLANAIKRFFVGLPQIIRMNNNLNNYLQLDEKYNDYKSVFLSFNVNPYDAIFQSPKRIFGTKNYSEIFNEIKGFLDNTEELLLPFKLKIINRIKKMFLIDMSSSLKTGFSDYLDKSIDNNERPVLDGIYKNIFNLISLELKYDDFECIDKLSKIITNQHIEDWDSDKTDQIERELNNFKENMEKARVISGNTELLDEYTSRVELTGMASLLKNNVESILDEFSGSVSSSEKIAVLSSLLKDLL